MTRTLQIAGMLFCLALMAGIAGADDWNKKTVITFSGPVKVENTTLPAGTYVFKLMSGEGGRHIVQILSKDESKLYVNILTFAASRVEPSDETEVTFADTSSSGAKHRGVLPRDGLPLKQWFYPGDLTGVEFPAASEDTSSRTTAQARTTSEASTPLQMPETAGMTPLVALIGLLSLSLGAGLPWMVRQ